MLSLNDAPKYSTWFYLWWTQGGATQRGTPGYCVVHHTYKMLAENQKGTNPVQQGSVENRKGANAIDFVQR